MANAYGFATEQQIRRVIAATKRNERQPRNLQSNYLNDGSPSELWFPFKNSTGSTVTRSGLIRITGLTTDNDNSPILDVAKPSTTFGRIYAVNSPEPVPSGQYGVCFIGDTPIELAYDSTQSPAAGETYGPKPDSFVSWENYPGFICMGIVDSTNHIMLATREEITHLVGKADSNIAAQSSDIPGSGTVSVHFRTGGSGAYADSGINITGYNLSDAEVTANKLIQLKLVAGDWLVDFEGCS